MKFTGGIKLRERDFFNEDRRNKPYKKFPKTEHERKKTQEEVQQIKKNLSNFSKSIWSKQWVNSILQLGRPFRMQRGIDYALNGKIDALSINKGHIFSTVQGTAPTPYRINIHFHVIPEEEWKKIIEEIAKSPLYLIELLEGILPEEIAETFKKYGHPLFPDITKDGLNATCSCPDKEVPCKHIAATILYIARVLDYDPFILLKLRGKTKGELLRELHLSENDIESRSMEEESKKIKKKIKQGFNVPKIGFEEISSQKRQMKNITELNFQFRKPPNILDIPENLGNPPNLENPTAFNAVLKAIYRFVTNEEYIMAMKLEED